MAETVRLRYHLPDGQKVYVKAVHSCKGAKSLADLCTPIRSEAHQYTDYVSALDAAYDLAANGIMGSRARYICVETYVPTPARSLKSNTELPASPEPACG